MVSDAGKDRSPPSFSSSAKTSQVKSTAPTATTNTFSDLASKVAMVSGWKTDQSALQLSDVKPISEYADMALPPDWMLKANFSSIPPVTPIRMSYRPMIITAIPDSFNPIPTTDLILLVNPRNLTISKSKITSWRRGREGYRKELWGDNLDKLTADGQSAAFYSSFTGLTDSLRESTVAFHNLYSLYIYYRNNGKVFNVTQQTILKGITGVDSKQGVLNTAILKKVGQVIITYGRQTFYGSFDTFSLKEQADTPYVTNYSFSFDVRRMSETLTNGDTLIS